MKGQSVQTMIWALERMEKAGELDDYDSKFVRNVAGRAHSDGGSTRNLTGPQVEHIERVWRKHNGTEE